MIDRKQAIKAITQLKFRNNFLPSTVVDALREQPTVEAIPVEWIKAFAEKNKNHIQDSVNKYTYMYDFLISEWRAENET